MSVRQHLVSTDQLGVPIGTPVITACGKVRPRKPGTLTKPICRKCARNVEAIGGSLIPDEMTRV